MNFPDQTSRWTVKPYARKPKPASVGRTDRGLVRQSREHIDQTGGALPADGPLAPETGFRQLAADTSSVCSSGLSGIPRGKSDNSDFPWTRRSLRRRAAENIR